MLRFGLNPYGQPLYRIVFAPSRRNLVGGVDGQEYRWVPTYRLLGDVWVMERWVDPFEFSQMSREQWDREMVILGPYPDRGEYTHAHTFETGTPDDASLEKLVMWIEEGRKRPYVEKLLAIKEAYEKEDLAVASEKDAIIQDAMSAWLDTPFESMAPGAKSGITGRGSKTAKLMKTAEELGLPTEGGKFITAKVN